MKFGTKIRDENWREKVSGYKAVSLLKVNGSQIWLEVFIKNDNEGNAFLYAAGRKVIATLVRPKDRAIWILRDFDSNYLGWVGSLSLYFVMDSNSHNMVKEALEEHNEKFSV